MTGGRNWTDWLSIRHIVEIYGFLFFYFVVPMGIFPMDNLGMQYFCVMNTMDLLWGLL